MKEFMSKVFTLRNLRIMLAIFAAIAILLAILLFIPSKGGLTSELTGTDFNGDGDAMRVRATIVNESNKPAFKVSYEIIVTKEDGTVLGTYTETIGTMMPGATKNIEEFLYFDEGVDIGNVEINTNGYIIGE